MRPPVHQPQRDGVLALCDDDAGESRLLPVFTAVPRITSVPRNDVASGSPAPTHFA